MIVLYRALFAAAVAILACFVITRFLSPSIAFNLPFLVTVVVVCLITAFVSPLLSSLPTPDIGGKKTREEGEVKWFNGSKGYGFVTRTNGEEIFVHFRSVRGDGRRGLREGQRVSFHVGEGTKGPQAEDVEVLKG